MRNRKLFVSIIAAIMVAMLFSGCEESGIDSKMYVVGTVPEGYMETFTSLEDCLD